jgi:rubredoxin
MPGPASARRLPEVTPPGRRLRAATDAPAQPRSAAGEKRRGAIHPGSGRFPLQFASDHQTSRFCTMSESEPYKKWMCVVCGWIYDEEEGDPDSGLAPGTRWEDVPESWVCPDCGAGKEDFEMVEF